MKEKPTRETLIRYLLNEGSEQEAIELEHRYLADDEPFDQLLVAEDDLIDEYVREELSPSERERFERHFTILREQRERLHFARSLATAGRGPAHASGSEAVASAPSARRSSFLTRSRTATPSVRVLITATGLAVAIVGALLIVETSQRHRQLSSKPGLGQDPTHAEQPKREPAATSPPSLSQKEPVVAGPETPSLVLLPNLTRESSQTRQLAIPTDGKRVLLELRLETAEHKG